MSEVTRKKLKVIYCMGSGRSGTTLLSIIMNNHPDIVGPGEINSLKRLPQEKFNCSCGKRVEECDYWTKVMNNWKKEQGESAVEETISKISAVENFKSIKSWLKAIFGYPGKSKYFKDYLDNIYTFLEKILEQSDKSVIIDISKNPLRAFVLMQHPDIDLRVIHLVRDGRGVAYSLNKFNGIGVKRKPVWRSALFWYIVNRQSEYVRKRAENAILVNYEDLATQPEKTLSAICDMAEIDSQPVIDVINSDVAPKDAHIMAGNQLRKQKSIRIKLNTEWKEKLSKAQKRTFLSIAGRTLSRYGYGRA